MPGLWRVRAGDREASARLLDAALEKLLGLDNRQIAELTLRILEWELAEQPQSANGDADGRRQREVDALRRLLTQQEADGGRSDSPVARAARTLLDERLGIDAASDARHGKTDELA